MSSLRGFKLRLALTRLAVSDAFTQSYKSVLTFLHYLKSRVELSMAIEDQIDTLIAQVGELVDATTVKKQYFDTVIANATAAVGDVDARLSSASTLVSDAQAAATSAQETAASLGDLDAALAAATSDADRAETAAASAQSVVTQDLSAIAAEISGTAVDVFIYDTTTDSDGGAWRKRCQHTSWYNEPLNTATRGARREFPAVAVLVLTPDALIIYDGDDPALPMWLVWEKSGAVGTDAYKLWRTNIPSNVWALNGLIAWGLTESLYDTRGVAFANMLEDVVGRYGAYASVGGFGLPASSGAKTDDLPIRNKVSLVGDNVYSVRVGVLSDAPINRATGLPALTIGAATRGGLCFVKDDGTVWNVSGSYLEHDLAFNEDWSVMSVGRSADRAFKVALSGDRFAFETNGGNNTQSVLTLDIRNETRALALEDATSSVAAVNFIGGGGLSQLAFNRANPAGSMVAYTAADYASGWMVGDCKGAFLASTDATALVGGEILSDGSFDTSGVWDVSTSGIDVTGGQLVATSAANNAGSSQPVSLASGEVFTISLDVASQSGGRWAAGFVNASNQIIASVIATRVGVFSKTFVLSQDAVAVRVYMRDGGGSGAVNSVSVKRADHDRSAYGNGLIINGTLTRNPVADGAELVAYSGFSADNYLEQPYNADLDFGTGDFCVMGWVNTRASGSGYFMEREGSFFIRLLSGSLRFGLGSDTLNGPLLTNAGWRFVCCGRSSGQVFLYVDAKLEGSAPNVENIDGATPNFVFGLSASLIIPAGSTDYALWRISATAPTANQIRKIYEDERELFKAGAAACTLHGSDSMVKALAYDDATDLLHVGTSEGRSVFKGLRRIDNTTDPVTTAISASNGMVIEQ